jgi:hypothetical protein
MKSYNGTGKPAFTRYKDVGKMCSKCVRMDILVPAVQSVCQDAL